MRPAHHIIRSYNAAREPERLERKYAAMRANPFVFLRGTAHLFFERLHDARQMPDAPVAACCGDLHLENFGAYLGDNGLSYFDLTDFDEAALAPATLDILRLITSILVAAPVLGMKRPKALELVKRALDAYRDEVCGGKARWIERRTSVGIIGELMNGLKRRDAGKFLGKRTVIKNGERRLNIDGERALPITAAERKSLKTFVTKVGTVEHDRQGFKFLDAARRVSGTGSLGIPRYVILVEGVASPGDNMLLDLKAAQPSALAPFFAALQPEWSNEAARTVGFQFRMQAVAPHLLQPVMFEDRPFLLKEMQPTSDRLNLAVAADKATGLDAAIASMAELSAWGQLRASGRNGAANADALIDYASAKSPFKALLDLARHCEAGVLADYEDYAAAYDAGAFALTTK
jgi:uncharacterized protein (DUF2252 family)